MEIILIIISKIWQNLIKIIDFGYSLSKILFFKFPFLWINEAVIIIIIHYAIIVLKYCNNKSSNKINKSKQKIASNTKEHIQN